MGLFRDTASEKELRELSGGVAKFYIQVQTGQLPPDLYSEFVTDMGGRIKDLYFQVERERGTRAANKVSIEWVRDMVRIWASDTRLSVPGTTRHIQMVLRNVIGM